MSNTIENLLVRNLDEVFGEHDASRRSSAIAELFTADCVFSDPRGRHVGHQALENAVATLQAQFPSWVFVQTGGVDTLQDSGRMAWSFGPPGEPHHITGLDVAVVNGERISALYTFLDPVSA